MAKDKFYPSFNGRIGNMKLILCDKAFDIERPVDPKPPITPEPPKPDPEPECIEGSS